MQNYIRRVSFLDSGNFFINFSIDRLRVDNTESVNEYYLKHSNSLYNGIHANDLHVCLWLHVKGHSPKCRSMKTSLNRTQAYDGNLPATKICPAIYRSRLALAAEISEILEDYGHTVTARTHDVPYSMWRRGSMCLPWKIVPAILLRVDDTEHSKPILL